MVMVKLANKFNFTPFPELKTGRLRLRALGLKDINEIFALRTNKSILEFQDRAMDKSIEDSTKYIQKITKGIKSNKWILWAITESNSDILIGTICLWNISHHKTRADLGYELIPQYQGKGYMSEAIDIVINYGFNVMKLERIDAVVDINNIKSKKLLEKCNFELDYKYEVQSSIKKGIVELEVYKKDKEEIV